MVKDRPGWHSTKRLTWNSTACINFKSKWEVAELFKPFEKLHLGFCSHTIREDEGPTDPFIFVGGI